METLNDFKNSFQNGNRMDLNFKFFSHLTDDEAADFIEELLARLGTSLNDGRLERIAEHIVQGQTRAYSRPAKYNYEEGPFIRFRKNLSETKIALLTSTGHFLEGDDPAPLGVPNMSQQEAVNRIKEFLKEKPVLSTIPKNTPVTKLKVRHGGYDISGVQADQDTAFPLNTLSILEQQGHIGELAQFAYSFVGACSQEALKKEVQQEWVKLLKQQDVDAALLVPV